MMYRELENIHRRPEVFSIYTAETLWTDQHLSEEMLKFHVSPDSDLASRKLSVIEATVSHIDSLFGLAGRKLCDLGCGPGLFAERFASMNARVTGIDFSERALDYARNSALKAGLHIDYKHGNYLDIELPQDQDLMTLIYCDLCALSPEQRKILLKKIAKALKPNGSLLLDVFSLARLKEQKEQVQFARNLMNGFWSASEYFAFQNSYIYRDEGVTLDKYTIIQEHRIWTVYNWLQHFSKESLAEELRQCGLTISMIFGDLTGREYSPSASEFAVIAHPL